MKLYFSPGACSLAPHIVFEELGLPYQTEKVSTKEGRTETGADFSKINPKGAVPTLQLDNGQVLTEGAVIMQYLADQKPEAKLLPPAGSFERVRAQEWLNYVATEIHKGFGSLFGAARLVQNADGQTELKTNAKSMMGKKFDYLSQHFEKNKFLLGNDYCVADAYLFTTLNWSGHVGIDLTKWPKLVAFMDGVKSRPATQRALKAEGLI